MSRPVKRARSQRFSRPTDRSDTRRRSIPARAPRPAVQAGHGPDDLVARDDGESGTATSPSRMCRSVRHTPQAWTSIRSCPGRRTGRAPRRDVAVAPVPRRASRAPAQRYAPPSSHRSGQCRQRQTELTARPPARHGELRPAPPARLKKAGPCRRASARRRRRGRAPRRFRPPPADPRRSAASAGSVAGAATKTVEWASDAAVRLRGIRYAEHDRRKGRRPARHFANRSAPAHEAEPTVGEVAPLRAPTSLFASRVAAGQTERWGCSCRIARHDAGPGSVPARERRSDLARDRGHTAARR